MGVAGRDTMLAAQAKAMRASQTHAERRVWQSLRRPPLNAHHFRRQVAFDDRYIADFASHSLRIIIEVDGRSHELTAEPDAERTRWFAAIGYRVVRIANALVHGREPDLHVILADLLGV